MGCGVSKSANGKLPSRLHEFVFTENPTIHAEGSSLKHPPIHFEKCTCILTFKYPRVAL